jgi:hypothetical protein
MRTIQYPVSLWTMASSDERSYKHILKNHPKMSRYKIQEQSLVRKCFRAEIKFEGWKGKYQ